MPNKKGRKEELIGHAYKFVQECLSYSPVVILGSGHSAGYGLPTMNELATYLCTEIPKKINNGDKRILEKFVKALDRLNLEEALHEIQLGADLTNLVIRTTWECIIPKDTKLLEKILLKPIQMSLSRLYRHIFDSTNDRIALITTNYDRLAEYAADAAGFAWATGYGYGYIGQRYSNQKMTVYRDQTLFRTVDIWKVHGSIDWFRNSDGYAYALPSIISVPKGYDPIIVTPGVDKYRKTHEEPFRSIISGADNAMSAGSAFLSIGYGFNDDHIQPKLIEKCRRDEKYIVVLSKILTESTKKVLLDGHCKHFIAFEEHKNGTYMYSPEHLSGIALEGLSLWSLNGLLGEVL